MRRLMREPHLVWQLLRHIELGANAGDQRRPDHTPMHPENTEPISAVARPSRHPSTLIPAGISNGKRLMLVASSAATAVGSSGFHHLPAVSHKQARCSFSGVHRSAP